MSFRGRFQGTKLPNISEHKTFEYLEQVESKMLKVKDTNETCHHEDSSTHNNIFRKDYTALVVKLLPFNQFLEYLFIKFGTDIGYCKEVRTFVDSIPEQQ